VTIRQPRYADHAALPPLGVTLGSQVRAEAIRRGGAWEAAADQYAALAVKWYGRRPCRGEDLRIVFEEVFRTDRKRP
jgi:hypothetical protein